MYKRTADLKARLAIPQSIAASAKRARADRVHLSNPYAHPLSTPPGLLLAGLLAADLRREVLERWQELVELRACVDVEAEASSEDILEGLRPLFIDLGVHAAGDGNLKLILGKEVEERLLTGA